MKKILISSIILVFIFSQCAFAGGGDSLGTVQNTPSINVVTSDQTSTQGTTNTNTNTGTNAPLVSNNISVSNINPGSSSVYIDTSNGTQGGETSSINVVNSNSEVIYVDSNKAIKVDDKIEAYPIYQFYSPSMKDHFWTMDTTEVTNINNAKTQTGEKLYDYKGIAGYALKEQVGDSIPVYRFYNDKTLDHFYTTSENEKTQVELNTKEGKDNYVYEGIAWYVPQKSTKPVYRFFDTVAFNHYYTSDTTIANTLIEQGKQNQGTYRYEDIAWYWY